MITKEIRQAIIARVTAAIPSDRVTRDKNAKPPKIEKPHDPPQDGDGDHDDAEDEDQGAVGQGRRTDLKK